MLLSVENLSVSYGRIRALHGVSFHVAEGEIVCIIGANGAGKSTTLRAISRMIPVEPDSKMTYIDHNLLEYPAFDRVLACRGTWIAETGLISAGRFDEITRITQETVELIRG